ncbi:MAG: hypothetical protein HQL67_08375 [Magnetococcales bacterium]|nr:hypothetical protein [Magnetococcales bacterium]
MAGRAKKGTRTTRESLTLRFDPKTRYGLELLARRQHRTVSAVVEWAVGMALHHDSEGLIFNSGGQKPELLLDKVWDVSEPDRLIRLAETFPDLLSYDEGWIWKILNETTNQTKNPDGSWNMELIRNDWELIKEYAAKRTVNLKG